MAGFVRYGEKNINLLHVIDIDTLNVNKDFRVRFFTIKGVQSWTFDNELKRDRVFKMLMEHMTNIEL